MREIHVGTCGFCLPQQQLFQTFRLLEVQQTFYQPPLPKTVERWRQKAPEPFEFSLKAFQAITHPGSSPTYRRCKLGEQERAECGFFRDSPTVRSAWATTRNLARLLRATWVIFQCPASFRPTEANVRNLRWFFQWAGRDELRFGWEPRGAAWTSPLVSELCRELELVHVVDPFLGPSAHGRPLYYRLHGIGGYEYRYSDEELRQLLAWCPAETGTSCLFNNTNMLEDALRFLRLLNYSA